MIGEADAIAVVGIAARVPGASTHEELWRNVLLGRECLSRFDGSDDESVVPVKGVLARADEFDAEFFGFSPREAEITEPQQRIFLQLAWHALEDAGHTPETCGRVGVFASSTHSRYLSLLEQQDPGVHDAAGDLQLRIATESDFLATRVAYKLNLRGPAVTVQTACSSSLVAVHLACGALLAGDCDSALAGGVTITLPLRAGYRYQQGSILSPDGHCRAFDARAQGTVPGNGGGAVLLRRLEDAIADGDDVYALVVGSAINNDGSEKIGFTAPSSDGQERAIRSALTVAGVEPSQVGLIEAHGTGTPLGDPIEVEALRRVFGDSDAWIGLGSVKSNVGHLDAAAGIVGFIKAVHAVREGVVPPTAGFATPSPALQLERTPFRVVDAPVPWRDDVRRVAGVSAFGVGGTNAHVVCAQALPVSAAQAETPVAVAAASARTSAAAEELRDAIAAHLEANPGLAVADVARTLRDGRVEQSFRVAAVGRDTGELARALGEAPVVAASSPATAFLFPGQGSRWREMGRELIGNDAYARAVERARRVLAGVPLWLDSDPSALETRTDVVQVALFVHQMGIVELLAEAGVRPAAVLGHSVGEISAACAAGILDFDDALRLVMVRGQAMRELCADGAMLAVAVDEERALGFATGAIELAAVNAASRSVLAGPVEAVDELAVVLEGEGIAVRRLDVDRGFHTASIEPALEAVADVAAQIPHREPDIAFLSAADGRRVDEVGAAYWPRQARHPVRYHYANAAIASISSLAVDIGPGGALASLAAPDLNAIAVWPARGASREADAFAAAQAVLWTHGAGSLPAPPAGARRTHLPGYPFARERHWPGVSEPVAIEPTEGSAASTDEGDDWLATIFEDVLGTRPAADDSFFDLGGDSLAAVQLLNRVAEASGTTPDLEAFFDEPTIAGLHRQLEGVPG